METVVNTIKQPTEYDAEWEHKKVAKTLEDAIKSDSRYYWGSGCRYHPSSPLFTKTQYCVQCTRDARAAYNELNRAIRKDKRQREEERMRQWRIRNRKRIMERLSNGG